MTIVSCTCPYDGYYLTIIGHNAELVAPAISVVPCTCSLLASLQATPDLEIPAEGEVTRFASFMSFRTFLERQIAKDTLSSQHLSTAYRGSLCLTILRITLSRQLVPLIERN